VLPLGSLLLPHANLPQNVGQRLDHPRAARSARERRARESLIQSSWLHPIAPLCALALESGCATASPAAVTAPHAVVSRESVPAAPNNVSSQAFAARTESPQIDSETPSDSDEHALARACGAGDAALDRVARDLAASTTGADRLDVSALDFRIRAEGAPYVWPRAWRFDGTEGELDTVRARLQRWLASFNAVGERRCGVALVRAPGARFTAFVVAVDVLADLEPVPTRVRIGQWVDVRAQVHVPADAAKLVVLGPRGAPHAVPTTFEHGYLQARFNADHAGAWLVQVLAAVDGGPRPLLEALVFAGVEPSADSLALNAPGEERARGVGDPAAALYEMVNAARLGERVPPLTRDARLDELAHEHAEAMRAARKTAHDAGDGDLNQRLENAQLELRAGENVAHAASVVLAERALWASPSHRENLLFPEFGLVGIGVATDADGTLWVCEIFAPAK